MEELVQDKLGLVAEALPALRVQHDRRRQVLPPVLHRDDLHVGNEAGREQAVFHLRQADPLFFYLDDGIRAALQDKAAVIKDVNEVVRRKSRRILDVGRDDDQAARIVLPYLRIVKGCPVEPVLGLAPGDAARFGGTIDFDRPEAEQAVRLPGGFRRQDATAREDEAAVQGQGGLTFHRALEEGRRRNDHVLFVGKGLEFRRKLDARAAEGDAERKGKGNAEEEAVDVVLADRRDQLARTELLSPLGDDEGIVRLKLLHPLGNGLGLAGTPRGVHQDIGTLCRKGGCRAEFPFRRFGLFR